MSFYYLISTSAGLIFSFLLACGNGQTSSIPKSSKEPTDKPETYLVSDKPKNQNEQASLGSSKQRQTGQTAGVSWEIPGRWEIQPPRMMRVATYLIPKTTNSEEPSECAVFFFGQGQGGSVDLNLERWQNQFQTESGQPPMLAQRKSVINNIAVTTISLAGTYLASMGPMFQSGSVKKPNYKMLGAIVEAPEGNVCFKLTGPEKTVMGTEDEFQKLLNSLRK